MSDQFMGHRAGAFQPGTVLFPSGNEEITVSMAREALDLMISAIAKKNLMIGRYRVALKVLWAIQERLANRQTRKPSKKELEVACDVLSEVQKERATTQTQRDNIDAATSWCKLFVERCIQD